MASYIWVNMDFGYGLLADGIELSPEPMLIRL